MDRGSWIALLVRGHYPERPEIIAALTSPAMVEVKGTPFLPRQIEGALAYLDTMGIQAETEVYQRMRLNHDNPHWNTRAV